MHLTGLLSIAAALLTLSLAPADAGDLFRVGAGGAPFCETYAQLQELLRAMDSDDKQWMLEAMRGNCTFIPQGTKVAVLEDIAGSVIGNAAKVRAFSAGGSAVGYSLKEGYAAEP